VPFAGQQWVIMPLDLQGIAGVVPQKSYPVEIRPRSKETFYLSEASYFQQQMGEIKSQQNSIGRFLFYFKKAVIGSADGRRFRPKGDRGITFASRSG
jgi:hypothetical protein